MKPEDFNTQDEFLQACAEYEAWSDSLERLPDVMDDYQWEEEQ